MWENEGTLEIDMMTGPAREVGSNTTACEHAKSRGTSALHIPIKVGGGSSGGTRWGELIKIAYDGGAGDETGFAAAMAADPSGDVQTWWSNLSATEKGDHYEMMYDSYAIVAAAHTKMTS